MTIIEQIKAQIEGWLREYAEDSQFELGERYGYTRLLSFLSTLESEKPMNQDEDLDKEIKRYIDEYYQADSIVLIAHVARHFSEWQKEQDEKELSEKIAAAYQLGLADKEKQMMKEAVEGYIERDCGGQLILGRENSPAGDEFMLLDSSLFPEIHAGRECRVRIIIVKED